MGKLGEFFYFTLIRFKWKYILLIFILFFAGSWWATEHFEPGDITSSSEYWWYFLNTALRANSGTYVPLTAIGRIVSMSCIVFGNALFIVTACKILSEAMEFLKRKRKGESYLKMKDHIVILGHRVEETEELIKQLRSDHQLEMKIVLCSKLLEENPFSGLDVEFVKGDTSSDYVLTRACVSTAKIIVVHGHTDERTLMVCIAAHERARKDAHFVAHINSKPTARYLKMLSSRIECVMSLRAMLIAQAIINPGSTSLLEELVSQDQPGTNFRIDIPNDVCAVPFSLLLRLLHEEYHAIVIGYTKSHDPMAEVFLNPSSTTMISGGMSLFYIAQSKLNKIINWDILSSQCCLIEQDVLRS